jgi:hypothetical protein
MRLYAEDLKSDDSHVTTKSLSIRKTERKGARKDFPMLSMSFSEKGLEYHRKVVERSEFTMQYSNGARAKTA